MLTLDGVKYHRVDLEDIPGGNATVPVPMPVVDEGKLLKYEAKMLAGSVGIQGVVSEVEHGEKGRGENRGLTMVSV